MSKSKNPFPKSFEGIYVRTDWSGKKTTCEVNVHVDNGWYSIYEQKPGYFRYTWKIGDSMRWMQLQYLVQSGRLIPNLQQDTDIMIDESSLEDIL